MTTSVKNGKKPKVVLDTNVLISALVFGGKPRQITDLLADEMIRVAISHEALTELRRKITAKFPDSVEVLKRFEKLLERDAQLVTLGSIQINICQDPDDNKFIETAVLGNCDFIISGDRHLLGIGQYEDIKIIKPAAFLKLLEDSKL
ncbi:putative toxin-antitoxin system toxin component, PIN family [Candidatus Saccharibacteria bacterium RIFCSPLOWO2_02_FULL_46_7]|nr:MAG: putative toxin-antitoxin system toxin component, PIN family [Candidatus Saccharibacteria bacterium RIFCSPLOWO2_02_FULL_46_7]